MSCEEPAYRPSQSQRMPFRFNGAKESANPVLLRARQSPIPSQISIIQPKYHWSLLCLFKPQIACARLMSHNYWCYPIQEDLPLIGHASYYGSAPHLLTWRCCNYSATTAVHNFPARSETQKHCFRVHTHTHTHTHTQAQTYHACQISRPRQSHDSI